MTKVIGIKYDQGKSRMELCDSDFLLGIGSVLAFGAAKYKENSWQGISKARYIGACMRHVLAMLGGEKVDEESGYHHALHAACCLMFIFWMDNNED